MYTNAFWTQDDDPISVSSNVLSKIEQRGRPMDYKILASNILEYVAFALGMIARHYSGIIV